MELNEQLFNDYIKSKNTTQKYNGFYIQKSNKFIICIKSEFYNTFKKRLINRKAEIIAEESKIINKETKEQRNYLFINCAKRWETQSAKALFKRYNLKQRKTRVLNPKYREYENQKQKEKLQRNKSTN